MTTRSVRSSQLKARRATKSLDDNVAGVIPLAMKLMKIPGPSGQEGRVSKFICDQLRRAGAPAQTIHSDDAHRRTPIQGETGNLVFKLPGTKRGPRRLLMAHLDTVPICVGSIPVRRGPLIVSANPNSGLGADDRAGAAVVLWTALKTPAQQLATSSANISLVGTRGNRHPWRAAYSAQPFGTTTNGI